MKVGKRILTGIGAFGGCMVIFWAFLIQSSDHPFQIVPQNTSGALPAMLGQGTAASDTRTKRIDASEEMVRDERGAQDGRPTVFYAFEVGEPTAGLSNVKVFQSLPGHILNEPYLAPESIEGTSTLVGITGPDGLCEDPFTPSGDSTYFGVSPTGVCVTAYREGDRYLLSFPESGSLMVHLLQARRGESRRFKVTGADVYVERDHDGDSVTFKKLPFGTYLITVVGTLDVGYVFVDHAALRTSCEVELGQALDLMIEVCRKTSGERIQGSEILIAKRTGRMISEIETGLYQIHGVKLGCDAIEMTVRAPGYAQRDVVLELSRNEVYQRFTVDLETGSLITIHVAHDGKGVLNARGAMLIRSMHAGEKGAAISNTVVRATSDSSGVVRIRRPEKGRLVCATFVHASRKLSGILDDPIISSAEELTVELSECQPRLVILDGADPTEAEYKVALAWRVAAGSYGRTDAREYPEMALHRRASHTRELKLDVYPKPGMSIRVMGKGSVVRGHVTIDAVDSNGDEPLIVRLSQSGALCVSVVDHGGKAKEGGVVLVSDGSGQEYRCLLSREGSAVFEGLRDGSVHVAYLEYSTGERIQLGKVRIGERNVRFVEGLGDPGYRRQSALAR